MHHLYPTVKGDPLCPLGFHPQVRWPTRCKRCFRDYKEHGNRKKDDDNNNLRRDDVTISSPSLSTWNSASSRNRDDSRSTGVDSSRNWASSTSLSTAKEDNAESARRVSGNTVSSNSDARFTSTPTSWTSTPDLAHLSGSAQANVVSYNLPLPKKRTTTKDDDKEHEVVLRRPDLVIKKTDTLAERVKKMQALNKSTSNDTTNGTQTRTTRIRERDKDKDKVKEKEKESKDRISNTNDVQFLIQVKSKTGVKSTGTTTSLSSRTGYQSSDGGETDRDDVTSIADTETTDTTLVGNETELQEQIDSLKQELEVMKTRCERAEREKSDILLRRLATYETSTSKTTASEVLKLQQKVNELQSVSEDLRDEKKSLALKVRELEDELESRPTSADAKRVTDELQAKLTAAEALCEELMDENEDMKKELRNLEEEIEEMQDNFREDQADEYTSLKKELEQTSKNCRILSFKLRKSERKIEELEGNKRDLEQKLQDVAGDNVMNHVERIKQLEQDLKLSTEVSIRLQKELEETNDKLLKLDGGKQVVTKKKAPMLGSLERSSSGDGKVSRETLTRGGSQEDPVQLLRDLQDSIEREADLREQLRFAEEEAQNLRRKASRIEDDNESLVLQLKKMATKARSRKLSPTSRHLSPDSSIEKDEGISDVEDPAELKILLELNEQEAAVLRRKVEDLEIENERLNKKVKELHEKKLESNKNQITTSTKITAIDEKKIKVLEEEISELRKKMIEKDRDYERLNAELTLTQKQRSKGTLVKSKSLDDQQALDIKRQMEMVEQEAQVLRGRISTLETDNEKLTSENKRLQLLSGTKKIASDKSQTNKITSLENELADVKKKLQIYEDKSVTSSSSSGKESFDAAAKKKLKEENDKLKEQLKKLETEKINLSDKLNELKLDAIKLRPRTPKKPTDLTTKLQMKKMVLDLENEISELLVQLKLLDDERERNKSDTNHLNDLDTMKMKLSNVEEQLIEQTTNSDNQLKNLSLQLDEAVSKCLQLEKQNDQLQNENIKLTNQLQDLNSDIKSIKNKNKDTDKLTIDLKGLKKELEMKEKECDKLKKDVDKLQKLEQEKIKLSKELDDKVKKINTLESKMKDMETKLKDSEKQLTDQKAEISQLEKTISSKKTSDSLSKSDEAVRQAELEIKQLKAKLTTQEQLNKTTDDNQNKLKLEIETIQKKNSALENDIKVQKDQANKQKLSLEKELKNKDLEISKLESKIKILDQTSGVRNKKMSDVKKECDEQVNKMKDELKAEKQQYEDLTAKYELLEEEHVVTKAQFVAEKETLTRQLQETEINLETMRSELYKLREKNEQWQKDKQTMQDKLKELEPNESIQNERARHKSVLKEKLAEIEQLRKETDVVKDQLSFVRRENDELRKKLDDYDKVAKVQRSMSADSSALEKEIRQLTNRCANNDKMHKIEMTQCKMRYDNQVAVLTEELQSLQDQVTRFKRERDNFKHMLETAQRTMSDLKSKPSLSSSYDENEDTRTKLAGLEQQISCLEDELSEARLESSKLKTELVSERSSWEIKLSEMKTRVNELEEERIIASGRSKIAGQRTRMELAWQKEREEQQRLLQETSTLARDLRQTLFEVERERDKERLESKRKHDQLKKLVEEEQEENKKKINEIQCDLLELRDAHAKLRTTNEKLRREKERHDQQYEEMRSAALARRRADLEEDRKLSALLEQVEDLIKLVPELSNTSELNDSDSNSLLAMTPTAPRRIKGPKSRESSPSSMDRRSMSKESSPVPRRTDSTKVQLTLQRLNDATEELRRYQRLGEAEREKERARRLGMRRAASTENESGADTGLRPILVNKKNGLHKAGNSSLKRRSLSLEQTSSNRPDQTIWKNDDDSLSSIQSLDGKSTSQRYLKQDASLDSRLSGGSTQSEIINTGNTPKKKKGFISKLKNLTKSHSIDDSIEHSSHHQGSDSDVSLSEDVRSSKKDLKGRITGIFRRGGSSSRSNSLERNRKELTPDSSSLQRPLTKNGSSSLLNRSTPVRQDESSAASTSSNKSLFKRK